MRHEPPYPHIPVEVSIPAPRPGWESTIITPETEEEAEQRG